MRLIEGGALGRLLSPPPPPTQFTGGQHWARNVFIAKVQEEDLERANATQGENVVVTVRLLAPHAAWHALLNPDPKQLNDRGRPRGPYPTTSFPIDVKSKVVTSLLPGARVTCAGLKGASHGRPPNETHEVCGKKHSLRPLCLTVQRLSTLGAAYALRPAAVLPPGTPVLVESWIGGTNCQPQQKKRARGSAAAVQRELDRLRSSFTPVDGDVLCRKGSWRSTADDERRQATRAFYAERRERYAGSTAGMLRNEHPPAAPRAGPPPAPARRKPPPPPASHLRIIQYNCRSVRANVTEVRMLLREHAPHLLLLQETWLERGMDTPRFPGYLAVRQDRPAGSVHTHHGGLLTLVMDGLWWSPTRGAPPVVADGDKLTEAQDLTVYPPRDAKVRVVHLYVPPSWGVHDTFSPDRLPPGACVLGDLNAHDPSWDKNVKAGNFVRGKRVLAWAGSTGARILNTGEPTRMSNTRGAPGAPAKCTRSAPDLTLVPPRFRAAKWKVLPCAGSDHAPIAVDLTLRCDPVRGDGRGRTRWALKKADWPAFRTASERALKPFARLDERTAVTDLDSKFTAAVLAAAREAVPRVRVKGRPGKKSKPWWSKEIEELVALRRRVHQEARAS
eukprot:gene3891-3601_t